VSQKALRVPGLALACTVYLLGALTLTGDLRAFLALLQVLAIAWGASELGRLLWRLLDSPHITYARRTGGDAPVRDVVPGLTAYIGETGQGPAGAQDLARLGLPAGTRTRCGDEIPKRWLQHILAEPERACWAQRSSFWESTILRHHMTKDSRCRSERRRIQALSAWVSLGCGFGGSRWLGNDQHTVWRPKGKPDRIKGDEMVALPFWMVAYLLEGLIHWKRCAVIFPWGNPVPEWGSLRDWPTAKRRTPT
jgi:hypothetical protein